MSEDEPAPGLAPYSFALTPEEARIAASRAGLRAGLAGRLSPARLAPLASFALIICFAAILSLTGLIGRRPGEAVLCLAAIAFMGTRLVEHWRLRAARVASLAAVKALQEAGLATIRLESAGLAVETSAGTRRIDFAGCEEAENVGGVVYLWPRQGQAAFIPARAFADEQTASQFLAFVRARIARARPRV